MKRKVMSGIILAAILSLAVWKAWSAVPVPLVENGAEWEIHSVRNEQTEERFENIDAEKLLSVLEKYERERTTHQYAPYFADEVQIDISLMHTTKAEHYHILLGDIHVISENAPRGYQILEGEQLLEEVLALVE